MSAPTKDQLDRYMDLVVDGEDPEDAIAVIWADEPEPAPPPAPKAPMVMVTEFPDGVVVGWDTCASLNLGCGKHVSKCKCKGGPRELKVFTKWREVEGSLPAYGSTPNPLAETTATTSVVAVTETGDVGRAGNESADLTMVPCVLGKHLVDPSCVDKNDDDTYSCFECQEKGLTRGPQVDG